MRSKIWRSSVSGVLILTLFLTWATPGFAMRQTGLEESPRELGKLKQALLAQAGNFPGGVISRTGLEETGFEQKYVPISGVSWIYSFATHTPPVRMNVGEARTFVVTLQEKPEAPFDSYSLIQVTPEGKLMFFGKGEFEWKKPPRGAVVLKNGAAPEFPEIALPWMKISWKGELVLQWDKTQVPDHGLLSILPYQPLTSGLEEVKPGLEEVPAAVLEAQAAIHTAEIQLREAETRGGTSAEVEIARKVQSSLDFGFPSHLPTGAKDEIDRRVLAVVKPVPPMQEIPLVPAIGLEVNRAAEGRDLVRQKLLAQERTSVLPTAGLEQVQRALAEARPGRVGVAAVGAVAGAVPKGAQAVYAVTAGLEETRAVISLGTVPRGQVVAIVLEPQELTGMEELGVAAVVKRSLYPDLQAAREAAIELVKQFLSVIDGIPSLQVLELPETATGLEEIRLWLKEHSPWAVAAGMEERILKLKELSQVGV